MDTRPAVFVVDDDPVTLSLLRFAAEQAGFEAECFASAEEFLESYESHRPGCIILDVQMPGMSGPELQQKLRGLGVISPILFVSGTVDVPVAVSVMKQGAADLIQKPIDPQSLIPRIQAAVELDARLRREREALTQIQLRLQRLTPREREVMDLVVAGLANKQIAMRLGLSEKTVEVHRGRVMHKMEADSVAQLVQMALGARAA